MPDELLLRGGTVVDGSGAPPIRADVLIAAGRVVTIDTRCRSTRPRTGVELDCHGLHVLPGFVDAHSHADFTLPTAPHAGGLLRQGVTTVVTGNCGFSPFPVSQAGDPLPTGRFLNPDLTGGWPDLTGYAAGLAAAGIRVNVAPLVGHGSVRAVATGAHDAADPRHAGLIRREIGRALNQGAFGVSLGLAYPDGRDADPAELVDIAALTAAAGGVLAVHLRDERAGCVDAVDEIVELARRTAVATQISHLKAMGRANWGSTRTTLAQVDQARAAGLDVTVDMYPYTCGATTLTAALPDWADSGGPAAVRRLVVEPTARARLLRELAAGAGYIGLDEVVVSHASSRWRPVIGRHLAAAAADLDTTPQALLLDILADDADQATMLVDAMAADDVDRVLAHPAAIVGSDGWVIEPTPGAHPRNFATFVRTLLAAGRHPGRLADAVRRQSAAVADRFQLPGRGRVTEGAWADLVVVDVDALRDDGAATGTPPAGIRQVFVNGVASYGELLATASRPAGRVLRREPSRRRPR
ncbi:N-acyl-D-amino-acid deacylase family protein [Micromonospora sp. NBC_01813]|uniref:N-acyl-D-amino-acid deacylase family protein n=1 Tax=Micromonospora sp. NBC_01813 TaxID=2975988 RepID=UPI002DDC8169|nr:amidohydrolase family protein [Micromonospora sp. NBC_01813]WSA10053.1 amidohydrolase family protein [Micromonospora sp. NBC_01813]